MSTHFQRTVLDTYVNRTLNHDSGVPSLRMAFQILLRQVQHTKLCISSKILNMPSADSNVPISEQLVADSDTDSAESRFSVELGNMIESGSDSAV